jgi:FkbM family methyltransferase
VLGQLPDVIVAHHLWRDQIVFPYHMQHYYDKIYFLDNGQGLNSYRNCDRRVYIEVGAGLGNTLLGLQSHYDECHAFEPHPDLFESLRTKHYPNCAKVVFHQKAVWIEKEKGSIDIYQDTRKEERLEVSSSSVSNLRQQQQHDVDTTTTNTPADITVPSTHLASFFRKIPLRSLIVLNIGPEVPQEDTVLVLRLLLDHAPLALRRVAFVVLFLDRGQGGGTLKALKARMREELEIRVCDEKRCPHRDPLAVKEWNKTGYHGVLLALDKSDEWNSLWNKYLRLAFVLWTVCEPGDDCYRPGDAPHYKVGGLSIIAISVVTVWLAVTICRRKYQRRQIRQFL